MKLRYLGLASNAAASPIRGILAKLRSHRKGAGATASDDLSTKGADEAVGTLAQQPGAPAGPFYVAMKGGFLVTSRSSDGRLRARTTGDVRHATTWDTFEEADRAGGNAVRVLQRRETQYYAVLAPASARIKVNDA